MPAILMTAGICTTLALAGLYALLTPTRNNGK